MQSRRRRFYVFFYVCDVLLGVRCVSRPRIRAVGDIGFRLGFVGYSCCCGWWKSLLKTLRSDERAPAHAFGGALMVGTCVCVVGSG